MAVVVNGSEIILSGTVGDLWFEDGFTSGEVIQALAIVGDDKDITVRLNSGGGIATEGAAIHAALSRHKGSKTVVVEGIAASAASLIAMAGDTIEMSIGSTMMIHDPSGLTFGTAADHEITLRALNALADSFAGVYSARSGKSAAQCRADMKSEIWLTPEEAVSQGYATRVGPEIANDNVPEPQAVAAFDYRIYARAPKQLVAMANQNGWRLDARRPAASSAPTPTKETPMSDPKGANASEQHEAAIAAARTEAAEGAKAQATAQAAEIATICAENGVPAMASALIREGVTTDQARSRANSAKDIKAAVETVTKSYPKIEASADSYIAAGKTIDQVRADLFTKITAAQSDEISTHHQPGSNIEALGSVDLSASMKKRHGIAA